MQRKLFAAGLLAAAGEGDHRGVRRGDKLAGRGRRRHLAVDETVTLLTSPLHPYRNTCYRERGARQNLPVSATAGGAGGAGTGGPVRR